MQLERTSNTLAKNNFKGLLYYLYDSNMKFTTLIHLIKITINRTVNRIIQPSSDPWIKTQLTFIMQLFVSV